MHNERLFVSTLVNLRLHVAVSTFHTLLRKANFNPSQPRIPAGEFGGGRWTDSADFDSVQSNSPLGTLTLLPMSSDDVYDVAATCGEHIAIWCKGSILREFPSQYLDSEIEDVRRDAQSGNAAARKALKLMFDKRFQK